MTVTITRAERDALYAELLGELSGLGDVYIELDHGNAEAARRLWRRFEPELHLLDQLGWRAVEPVGEFEIDLEAPLLRRALDSLRDRAEHLVAQHFEDQDESLGLAHRGLQVLATCRAVFSRLADADEGGARSVTAARAARDAVGAAKGKGERVQPRPRLRFEEAADRWLAEQVVDLRESTRDGYQRSVDRYLRPRWGLRSLIRSTLTTPHSSSARSGAEAWRRQRSSTC